ncbi:DUF6881 domain-containing protein [Zooshikella ganghwensis]|uniref:DUF6881 domain-containing protein n=1 Tax=Zooshikella ganghwensis TaxID=202772 RepID=UPI0003F63F25|nr:hypothetical protein [Zooshikella ganghwensis]
MNYIKARWLHSDKDYPYLIYSEFSEDRYETRKVEVFYNNEYGFASEYKHTAKTRLGLAPIPSIQELQSNPEFEVGILTKEQFENIWITAINQ